MLKMTMPADLEHLESGVRFIEDALKDYHIAHKKVIKAVLIAEEQLVRLIEAEPEDHVIQISIHRFYRTADIHLTASGSELKDDIIPFSFSTGDMNPDVENSIRSMLLNAFSDSIAYSRKGEYNCIKIVAGSQENVFALRNVVAFCLATATYLLLLRYLPDSAAELLVMKILLPIEEIFLNALRFVAAPAIFFSMLTSIANYSSFHDPGKVSAKVIAGFFILSVSAALIGVSLFNQFRDQVQPMTELIVVIDEAVSQPERDGWFLDMLVNIVPSNIIDPFLNTDSMQLLLTALVGGIALSRAGEYSTQLREMADALDKFCSATVELISSIIPLMVFFATILTLMNFGIDSLRVYGQLFSLVMLGFVVLLLLYMLIILIVGRLNPFHFLRKYAPSMWNTLMIGSGIQAIPDTMRFCERELGISPKVYSFSIPLGAIANTDGSCIYLSIAALFLAKLYNVEVTGLAVIPVVFVIVLLSVGAPITPGSVILALTMLVSQLGISLTVISSMLAFNAIIEMLLAMCNVIGDVAVTLVVAKTEDLLDEEVYNSRKKRIARN